MGTTIGFFYRQLAEFHREMGRESFWASPGRHAAITALGHVFHELTFADETSRAAASSLFLGAVDEFTRREAMYLGSRAAGGSADNAGAHFGRVLAGGVAEGERGGGIERHPGDECVDRLGLAEHRVGAQVANGGVDHGPA